MLEQKILIITYYWPPSGGSGVQRWLKFVKYLPQFGWKPVVFTPQNPAMVQQDESLLGDVPPEAEIVRFPIWEPYDVFFKISSFFTSGDKAVKPSQLTVKKGGSPFQKIANWVRGNFFIPDPKVFWVKPSVAFLDGYLKAKGINTIVTTGPPHSMHMIGYRLKKKNPSLNWIADFRDPWSEWPFLELFHLTSFVRSRHRKLESKVLKAANHVVTITPFYTKRFEKLSGKTVSLITNGFDEDDVKHIQYTRPAQFTIRHVGIVYEMANPKPLIDALTLLSAEVNEFKANCIVEFIGEVNSIFQEKIRNSEAGEMVRFIKPVPHKELMSLYGSTSALWLNLDGYEHVEGLLPGKIFEYVATGLPIVGVGPTQGDAVFLLDSSQTGKMFGKQDVVGIKNEIQRLFLMWKDGHNQRKETQANLYSRKALTRQLVSLLENSTQG